MRTQQWRLKRTKHQNYCLTSDLQKLCLYLVTEIDKILYKQSLEEMTLQEWSTLQKLTITRIITFNARRGSEPLKILVTDWERCLNDEWKRTEDIAAIDDPLEKLLADRLKVLYVKGKKRKRVPVLFTTEMQQSIILLNAKRDEVGVDPSNKYLFPRPTRGFKFFWVLLLVVSPFFQIRLVFSFFTSTGHFEIFSNFTLLFHFSGQTKVKDYNDPLPSTSSTTDEFLLHENIVTIHLLLFYKHQVNLGQPQLCLNILKIEP